MFSLGYSIPASIVLACYYYEVKNYDHWINTWLIQQSELNSATVQKYCSLENNIFLKENPQEPLLWIFLIKYVVQMILGIICGLWVSSMKTVYQWFNFCGCHDKVPQMYNSELYHPGMPQNNAMNGQMINGTFPNQGQNSNYLSQNSTNANSRNNSNPNHQQQMFNNANRMSFGKSQNPNLPLINGQHGNGY